MFLYHGTSGDNARHIVREGFKYGVKYNWLGKIKSKENFIYLSLAYAPYYAMAAKGLLEKAAIVKVSVDSRNLYPDEDFLYQAFNTDVYNPSFNLEGYKHLAAQSLKYLGNTAARPDKIKIIGMRIFDARKLMLVSDPTITPMNYAFMGLYYRKLSDWIYEGKDFLKFPEYYYREYEPEVYNMMKQQMSMFEKGKGVM